MLVRLVYAMPAYTAYASRQRQPLFYALLLTLFTPRVYSGVTAMSGCRAGATLAAALCHVVAAAEIR